jgi:REP element-mobilizing transposase RayT
MPDHMHFLAQGLADSSNGMKLVEAFKQETAIGFNGGARLWQFKYYDHILRAKDSPDAVAWYIWLNPVRKGFCKTPSDYPYLGSFSQIGTQLLQSSPRAAWDPPWKKPSLKV